MPDDSISNACRFLCEILHILANLHTQPNHPVVSEKKLRGRSLFEFQGKKDELEELSMHLRPSVRGPTGLHPGTLLLSSWCCCAGEVRFPPRKGVSGIQGVGSAQSQGLTRKSTRFRPAPLVQWLRLHTPNGGGLGLITCDSTKTQSEKKKKLEKLRQQGSAHKSPPLYLTTALQAESLPSSYQGQQAQGHTAPERHGQRVSLYAK